MEQSKIKEDESIAKPGIQAGIHIPGLQIINGKRVAVETAETGQGQKKGRVTVEGAGRVRGCFAVDAKAGPANLLTCKPANLQTCEPANLLKKKKRKRNLADVGGEATVNTVPRTPQCSITKNL